MTLIEAARLLDVSPTTLRVQVRNGKLRAKKVGRDWSVTPKEVERYRRESKRSLDATCVAVAHGPEYGPMSHQTWRCDRPAKAVVTMHQMADKDIQAPACGIHARVARTTGRVYVA